MGVCFLITLNKTNISNDATLSHSSSFSPLCHYVFLFLKSSLECTLHSLAHISAHHSQLLNFIHISLLTKPSSLWLSVFLVVVDLEPFLASQLDIFCKYWHSQDGPHLPCISLLSYSFVHVSLHLLII